MGGNLSAACGQLRAAANTNVKEGDIKW
jgi:hypothetical protein